MDTHTTVQLSDFDMRRYSIITVFDKKMLLRGKKTHLSMDMQESIWNALKRGETQGVLPCFGTKTWRLL